MTTTLFVAWQDPVERCWHTVGRLTREEGVYRFAYTRGAQRSARFQPFGHMRDLDVVYESSELFPLFANRLLSKERPEYRSLLDWLDMRDEEDDPLALLARTGGARETDSLMVFPRPEPTPDGRYQVRFFAQGLRHLPEYARKAVSNLFTPAPLFLMPDPQNRHDCMAIALRTDDPKTLVGYCPRYLTADLHSLLEAGTALRTEVVASKVNVDAPIQLRLLCTVSAPWPSTLTTCAGDEYRVIAADVKDDRPALKG